MKSICFPPSAFCFLPSADCLLPLKGRRSPTGRDGTCATPALCLLLTAYCRLPTTFQRGGMERVPRRRGGPGQDVTADRERKNQ